MKNKKILITGLFISEANKHIIYRTAADQLAELLTKNGYQLITTSTFPERFKRLFDTCKTIISKTRQYDIVITPLYGGYRSLVLEAVVCGLLRLLGKKIIMVIHGGRIPPRMKIRASRYIKVLNTADILVAPSNYFVHELKAYGYDVQLIENVLNLKNYTPAHKQTFRPHIFWMRTFEDVYDPLMAVRVFKLVKEKYPEAKMIMGGKDEGMLQATINLVNELQLTESISLPGYISMDQKNAIAKEFDIYICTNIIDNAPVSLVEMMSLGVAVVSTNAGGIPFLATHGYNALLSNVGDEKAMFNSIDLLLSDNSKAQQLVQNGLNTAQQYDEAPVIKKWVSIFSSLGYQKPVNPLVKTSSSPLV